MNNHYQNIERIKAVYKALNSLQDKVVFVGGAAVSLYAQREAFDVRETTDIDIVVEIASQAEYANIEEQLREIGFANDVNAGFVGRFLKGVLIVDVIPAVESITGFSNRWYRDGFTSAISYKIDTEHTVKIFDPPHYMATKIEAFKNRGGNDGRTSKDFEDIVYILENRRSIWEEMAATSAELKEYLLAEFEVLYDNKYIDEWIGVHGNIYSPPTSYLILSKMKAFIGR